MKQYLDIAALAERLRIKRSTLYAWAEQGAIPYLKLGRLLRFDPDEIEAWLQAHRQDATPEPTPRRRQHGTDNVDALIAEAKRTSILRATGNQTKAGPHERGTPMALYKRGAVWWMRFSYQGRRIRRSTDVTDRKLAERIYFKVRGLVAGGTWCERPVVQHRKVKDLLERYLRDHSAPNKAALTHRRDRSLAAHVLRTFGEVPLDQLRPARLAEYKASRRAQGVAPKTLNDELTLLRPRLQVRDDGVGMGHRQSRAEGRQREGPQ
jgi:excisionase family DNA binding protein